MTGYAVKIIWMLPDWTRMIKRGFEQENKYVKTKDYFGTQRCCRLTTVSRYTLTTFLKGSRNKYLCSLNILSAIDKKFFHFNGTDFKVMNNLFYTFLEIFSLICSRFFCGSFFISISISIFWWYKQTLIIFFAIAPNFFEIRWIEKEYPKKRFLLLLFLCAIKKEFFHLCEKHHRHCVLNYTFEKEVLLGKDFEERIN